MAEQDERALVVRLAREWLGLPYRDNARIRGVCGDCTFVALVYEDAGIASHVDIEPYSPQSHLHRTASLYIDAVRERARETNDPKPGDLAMYWFGRDFSHGAIVVDPGWPQVIHADKPAKHIIQSDGTQGHLAKAKEIKFFTLW